MDEKKFLRSLVELKDNECTKIYPAIITEKASASGKQEQFEVEVFKKFKGGYKLQWSEFGSKGNKPSLPKLEAKVKKELQSICENSTTFLTSGYNNWQDTKGYGTQGDKGMQDSQTVLRYVKELSNHGIIIDYR